jgi:dihydroflavonol-4-reductase
VHTSSSGVLGKPADGGPADESTPPDALVHSNLYFRSKLLAEQAIDGFLRNSNLPVVLVRPGWMFGPGDAAPTSAGQIVLDFLRGQLPLIIPGGGCPTDARDVAAAMVRAAERGQSGQRYVLGVGDYISFADLFRLLEELSGVPAPRTAVPYWAALGYAGVSETFGRLTGKPVLATVAGIRSLRDPRPLSPALAVRELGASFRPLRDTMRDTIAWFRAQHPAGSLRTLSRA